MTTRKTLPASPPTLNTEAIAAQARIDAMTEDYLIGKYISEQRDAGNMVGFAELDCIRTGIRLAREFSLVE